MGAPFTTDISDFSLRDATFQGKPKPVLITGKSGPAVIVVHEIYGFTPTVARLCRWVRDGGFRVYAPILLGQPDATNEEKPTFGRMVSLCVSREFTLLAANRSSPIVDWLKGLARQAHEECGGRGVGVIGMCLTGGFALSMAVDPTIAASVMAQPALPAFGPAGLGISPTDLKCVKQRVATGELSISGYRFEGDKLCRAERFAALRQALGPSFIGREIPDSAGNPDGLQARGRPPHSVLTTDLIDESGQPTREAVNEIIAFLERALGAKLPE
jgi:dienelactone hydrolase